MVQIHPLPAIDQLRLIQRAYTECLDACMTYEGE
jgi:hypothetical protein